jgi:beta-lactamase class A
MSLHRRTLLASLVTSLVGWPALAAEAPLLALAAYERDTGGRIGVFAEAIATGARIAWRADERFAMCSTFKASLAACVLARIDRGEDHLDSPVAFGSGDLLDYAPTAKAALAQAGTSRATLSVAAMCEAVVVLSDNACANLLLARIGGPAALTAFWRATGDTVSRLDHTEPLLNRSPPGDPHDTTTPAAMAATLRRFAVGDVLSPASRERFIGWLVACQTGANRLRAGLPRTWRIGDKTGNNGKDAFGDLAIAWPTPERPILIAAYTQGGTPDHHQVEAVFTAIGTMVGQRLA